MAKQLARLQPRGIVADQPPHFVPPEMFTSGENVSFRNARIQRVGGMASIWQSVNPLPEPPIHLLYSPYQGIGYWLICGADSVTVTDGITFADITPASPLQNVTENFWVSGTLNGLAILNNGKDAPIYWDGNTINACQTLPDWPTNTFAYSVRPYKYHLVALSIDGPGGLDDTFLQWSDAAAPGQVPQSWTIDPSSEAGNNILGDETGGIIDGLALRDDFIIYKRHSTYIMTYVGGQIVMAFRKLFVGVGVLGRNCVAELNGFHYVLADGDVFVHDGQTVRSIADDRVRETLFTLIDANFYSNSYVVANKNENEIYFCVPTGGLPEARNALVYHVDSDVWGHRDIPSCPHAAEGIVATGVDPAPVVSWDSFTTFWQFANRKWNQTSQTIGTVNDGVLFAQPDGYNGRNVLFLDAATLQNGLIVDARLERLSWDMGSPGQIKIVRRIWPQFTVANGTVFNFQVGGEINLSDPISFQSFIYTQGEDKSVDVLVTGRYISIIIETEQDAVWQLTGFDIEYELRSRF